MDEKREKLMDILGDFSTAVLVTHGRDGGIHGRPMSIAKKGTEEVWFITGRDSEKVLEVEQDHVAMVTMQEDARFLCLSGTVDVLVEPGLAPRLWKESWRPWFNGPEDPSIVVLRFKMQRGEYWDRSGINAVTFVWDAAKALAKGTTIETESPKRHGVIQPEH